MCVTPVYGHRGIAAQISRALELLLKNTHLHLYAFGEAWGPHKNLCSSPLKRAMPTFILSPNRASTAYT